MNPFVERVYLSEIVHQADAGFRALRAFEKAVLKDPEALHDHAADFLNHAAMVSKILDPADKGKAKRRGDYLRKKLNITDDEAVLSRKLRNYLEHIDEQIDKWASSGKTIFIARVVQDSDKYALTPGVNIVDVSMSVFITTTHEYAVFGNRFNLKKLSDSLVNVRKLAKAREEALFFSPPSGEFSKSGDPIIQFMEAHGAHRFKFGEVPEVRHISPDKRSRLTPLLKEAMRRGTPLTDAEVNAAFAPDNLPPDPST